MAKGLSLSNPALVGAGAALITYILVEEVFDDYIEDFFDALKGKKKDGRDGKGGRGKGKMRRQQQHHGYGDGGGRNQYGQILPATAYYGYGYGYY